MIQRFRVQNYKALRDVTLDLTPIHVLIGANDTGKTSILEAIAAACRSVDHELAGAFLGRWRGADLVWLRDRESTVEFDVTVSEPRPLTYHLSCRFLTNQRQVFNNKEWVVESSSHKVDFPLSEDRGWSAIQAAMGSFWDTPQMEAAYAVRASLEGVQLYRWNPRLMALPVAPDFNRRFRMESSGFGLALCLDDILGDDRSKFDRLEERFTRLFPEIGSIVLKREPGYSAAVDDPEEIPMLSKADGKGLYFRFRGGPEISASAMSDGALLLLGYLTAFSVPHVPRVVLVEEPENGVHPQRLKDVVSVLRDVVKQTTRTQVVMTTHSPMLVDLFSPEEVTLCQKNADGSVSVRRLSESQTVREQMDVFTLGEIWAAEGDEALAKPIADGGGPSP